MNFVKSYVDKQYNINQVTMVYINGGFKIMPRQKMFTNLGVVWE